MGRGIEVTHILILASVLLAGGCATNVRITDFSAETASEYEQSRAETVKQRRLSRSGDKLLVEINRVGHDMFIATIEPSVYRGELYLTTYGVSSNPGGLEKFVIDVGTLGLPPDWDQHVFWVFAGLGSPFDAGPLPAHTTRLKAEVRVPAS